MSDSLLSLYLLEADTLREYTNTPIPNFKTVFKTGLLYPEDLMHNSVEFICQEGNIRPALDVPKGVEVTPRIRDGRRMRHSRGIFSKWFSIQGIVDRKACAPGIKLLLQGGRHKRLTPLDFRT